MNSKWWLVLVIVFSIPAFFRLFPSGIHNIQDSMQIFRVYEMDKCLNDGQIPCRWVPDMGYKFGYPLFLYYNPGPYYVGAGFHRLGFSYIDSVKILFELGFVFSGLTMFIFLRYWRRDNWAAWIGSMLYIYAPVRAVQVYVRGSLGEFLSFIFFPLILLFSYKLIRQIGRHNILFLGLSITGLGLTHNLMSLAFAPLFVCWTGYWWWKNRDGKILKKMMMSLALAFGLSAFFVLPLIIESSYVHLESMKGGYFDYRQHFVGIGQFFSNYWGFGSSQLGLSDGISLSVGLIHILMSTIFLSLVIAGWVKMKKAEWVGLGFVNIGYMVIMHSRSAWIWEKLSFMAMFQFPWRFLVMTNLLLSILGAGLILVIPKKIKWLAAIIVYGLIWFTYGFMFSPQKWLNVTDNDMLTGQEYTKQLTASIFDYLPKSAVLPPNYPAKDTPEITSGMGIVEAYEKGSNWQKGIITIDSEKATVRLPILDFPGMVVRVDKKIVEHDHNDCSGQDYCFGQINFELAGGRHDISVVLGKTWPRIWGDWISIGTIVLLMINLFWRVKSET